MVVRRNYLTEEELVELIALTGILPGPSSTQTIVAIGHKIGGPFLAFDQYENGGCCMVQPKRECIAMILAGGQGSRLEILTSKVAKPAVPFGGKYRIIDFSLSNCSNSGIYTVGVLVQYQPLALNSYLGIGAPWGLDRRNAGVTVLPPFVRTGGGEWYKGTANALFQNIEFIEMYDPEYILVLSGDHVYKMDYSLMLDFHKEQQAATTIASIQVPWEEASRFGILDCSEDMSIVEFAEKPLEPKNNLASMGVYIFNWQVLKHYLELDEVDTSSAHDFGRNIIPTMLNNGEKMSAYLYNGYWKDVGTLESLWQANMDLLADNPLLTLDDPNWRIYSTNPSKPAQYIGKNATVSESLVNEGCYIEGDVKHSVLFTGVTIGKGSKVIDSVLMPNVRVGNNVVIHRSIVGSETVIEDHTYIGERHNTERLTVVGGSLTIPSRKELIGTIG